MRLDKEEKQALKYALKDFKGKVYLFGSRINNKKRGGDIDILLMPSGKVNPFKLALKIEAKFFSMCEEKLDVLVYRDTPFYREILKSAKPIDIARV